jgi:ADP-ribose pyrophosphatase YjhB (NUDIX family)
MQKVTLCFCVQNDSVLLAKEKVGFGTGKWNGYGGKVCLGETEKEAAIRELEEGCSLKASVSDLRQVALINLYFNDELRFECFVYLLNTWEGEPKESVKMQTPRWYTLHHLPFSDLVGAHPIWLPLVLNGYRLKGSAFFNHDGTIVKDFPYKPTAFT